MYSRVMSILEENERIEALRERKQFNDNQHLLMKSAQRRREWEYRAAMFTDIRYWVWVVVLVTLVAGFCGWWLRGTIAPTSAKNSGGILPVTSNQTNKTDGTLPAISNAEN